MRLKYIFFAIVLALALVGCSAGSKSDSLNEDPLSAYVKTEKIESNDKESMVEVQSEDIELLDPVGVATEFAVASYRTLYDVSCHNALLAPDVEEYYYSPNEAFDKYGALPGAEVAKGEVLVYGSTEDMQENIENLSKSITEKASEFVDDVSYLYEDLYDAQKREYDASVIFGQMKAGEPSEESAWYNNYEKMLLPSEGNYKSAVVSRERIEESIKEKEALYELEKDYDLECLDRLNAKLSQNYITSDTDGVVVGVMSYYSGDRVAQNSAIMAVGDISKKVLYCEYVSMATVNKAESIYAIINGKKYDVEYVPMEKEEYSRQVKKNDVVYSQFVINGDTPELEYSNYGLLVVVNSIRNNVLCVPTDAITKEGSDSFVYRIENDNSISTKVQTGKSDGIYTEILSGLNEGDKVLSKNALSEGSKTQKLSKGSISGEFSGSGYLYYPSAQWMVNPAKEGTFYIKSIDVAKYEQVEKGQVLATIEVVNDRIGIDRLSRKIDRQQERLVNLLNKKNEKKTDEVDRSLDRAIKSRQKAIEDMTKELNELNKYSGVIKLTAPCDGIVTDLTELKEGSLISYKERLVQVSDITESYIVVEDTESVLTYGNEATIEFKDAEGVKREVSGRVVTVTNMALDKDLRHEYTLININPEDIGVMAASASSQGGEGWWNRNRFGVKVAIRNMENVVTVPKTAVKEKNGSYYVKVNSKDGTADYVSFVAGGSDMHNFWVVDGLSEGMEICLE